MKTVAKVGVGVFVLILGYLLITHGDEVNKMLTTTGTFLLKGTAMLQGRPSGDLLAAGV
jgi:hypothetical protein